MSSTSSTTLQPCQSKCKRVLNKIAKNFLMMIVVASPLQCSSSHVLMKMEILKAFHLKASYSYIEIRLLIWARRAHNKTVVASQGAPTSSRFMEEKL